jgi:phage recombination protein Bet
MSQESTKALDFRKEKAMVTWGGRSITITFDDVKRHICDKASPQEVVVFLKMAQSLNLNPWAREIYMIKYTADEPASYVIASEAYLKAAEQCPEYDGHEAGIIVKDEALNLIYQEGTLFIDEKAKEKIVGGWAKVYRRDRAHPFYIAVSFVECAKYTKQGALTHFWDKMPATMIRKVALARALREAFPSRLGGMVVEAEFEDVTDHALPEAMMKGGKPDWALFYAKIKDEFGLTPKEAHELVGVEHFSSLLKKGWTMEGIWNALINAIREKKAAASGNNVDQETGEISESDKDFENLDKKPGRSPQPDRDPESLKDMNALFKACFDDFGMQPIDVARELGYSSTQEIDKTPAQCYSEIAVVRKQNES